MIMMKKNKIPQKKSENVYMSYSMNNGKIIIKNLVYEKNGKI